MSEAACNPLLVLPNVFHAWSLWMVGAESKTTSWLVVGDKKGAPKAVNLGSKSIGFPGGPIHWHIRYPHSFLVKGTNLPIPRGRFKTKFLGQFSHHPSGAQKTPRATQFVTYV